MMRLRTPRTTPVPIRLEGWLGALSVLLLAALLGGCEDSLTDPTQGLVAAESHAALSLGVELPDPGRLAGGDDGLDAAVVAWRASWELEPEEGMAAREPTYPLLARGFAQAWDDEALAAQMVRLEQGLQWIGTLQVERLPDHLATRVRSARVLGAAAQEALTSGDLAGAAEQLLRGADYLRMTSPPVVARALVSEAEGLLGRVSGDHPYSEQDLERVRRLVRGGRQALAEGDWARAIRRAYYATGILEGND